MDDIILFHGSRGGIEGQIQPQSRVRCDFGKGFYMGESEEQAKGLVVEDSSPVLYTLRLKLSQIPENKILKLQGIDWIYVILANRGKVEPFNRLKLAQYWQNELKKYDVVIGPIADDRMNEAMQRFSELTLTDEGLLACLSHVKYGNQFVAKTSFACQNIEILDESFLKTDELDSIRKYTFEKRKEGRNIIQQATINYRRQGKYLDEIIESQRLLEKRRERSR